MNLGTKNITASRFIIAIQRRTKFLFLSFNLAEILQHRCNQDIKSYGTLPQSHAQSEELGRRMIEDPASDPIRAFRPHFLCDFVPSPATRLSILPLSFHCEHKPKRLRPL